MGPIPDLPPEDVIVGNSSVMGQTQISRWEAGYEARGGFKDLRFSKAEPPDSEYADVAPVREEESEARVSCCNGSGNSVTADEFVNS